MHETHDELRSLQALLNASDERAGTHLRSIITPERRVGALELCWHLEGMTLLSVATVTADGRPLVGPVDAIFYRGAFHFGSSADSVRARHLAVRPQVSATHVPGEEFAVSVHGRAVRVDLDTEAGAGFKAALLEVYLPRYGADWEDDFLATGPLYWRIDADAMFTIAIEDAAGGAVVILSASHRRG